MCYLSTVEIHEQIRRVRKEQKMTQATLADEADTKAAVIWQIENGVMHPSRPMLHRIAEALGHRYQETLVPKESTEPDPSNPKHPRP